MTDGNTTTPDANFDSVLVGAPTYKGLAACLDEYLEAFQALHWHNKTLMLVDNTADGGKWAKSVRSKVEAAGGFLRRVESSDDWEDTFNRAWGVMLQHARWNGYQWIFSLEQDVIVPPLTLDTMLNAAGYCQAPFVTHTYPYHGGKAGFYQGFGCTLMKTELVHAALEVAYRTIPYVEATIYDCTKRNSHIVLHQLLDVQHRDADDRHWQFVGTTNDEVSVGIEQ